MTEYKPLLGRKKGLYCYKLHRQRIRRRISNFIRRRAMIREYLKDPVEGPGFVTKEVKIEV
jgi:hypothetical protein